MMAVPFDTLQGKTISKVVEDTNYDTVDFFTTDGGHFHMEHFQDCCESVYLADVAGGTLDALVGQKILSAYVETNEDLPAPDGDTWVDDCQMWTFYTIRTMFHTLTLRWFGSSNGYYSVDVNFMDVNIEREW